MVQEIKQMKKLLFTLILLSLFSGCINWLIEQKPEPDGKILIVNNSAHTIRFCSILKYELNNGDTALIPNEPLFDDNNNPNYLVYPNSTNEDEFSIEAMKQLLSHDIEMVYLFDLDTLEKYSWSEIALGYKVLKRVDFDTWEDMEKCNFTITYP
jgi:hypothetical protein